MYGNVLIKCNIPSFVKEYVTVTSWLQEPSFNIYPSLEGGKYTEFTYILYLNLLYIDLIRFLNIKSFNIIYWSDSKDKINIPKFQTIYLYILKLKLNKLVLKLKLNTKKKLFECFS